MKTFLFPLMLFLVSLESKSDIVESCYKYNIDMRYEINMNTMDTRKTVRVDGKRLTCICGEDPMLIMIVYGHLQCFCFEHMPHVDIIGGSNCLESECYEQ